MAQEARELIKRIRSEYSIELNGKVASILVNALEVLSYELYDTETHFLLELLQNADDNTYNTRTDPTLTITYQPGSLRVDCNETGFTASNVEAICTIRGSTKGSRDSVVGFTGEKVRQEKLGMICPSWAKFPQATSPNATSMFLQLGSDYNEELLEKQLREFDPLQLIFLKRIRRIHLTVKQKAGSNLNRSLRRVDYSRHGQTVTELATGRKKATFVVVKHQIQQLPKEPRRQNCTQSELALAFPTVDSSSVGECGTQNVYATLPIRDYGLKFLLHGDFVLTASRLEIETSLPWNKALRDSLADAFLSAVGQLNESAMKDVWPYFVPGPETSSFFEPARSMVMEKLKQRKVLLTFSKKMAEPSKLFYIDLTQFADNEGIPFTLDLQTEDRYLSPVYQPWILDILSSAGLRSLSATDFLEHLDSMISFDQKAFCNRPFKWHSELARALIPLQMDPPCKGQIKELPLIPIRSGQWVSANTKPVFIDRQFPELRTGVKMPGVVDSIAAKDEDRWKLFSMLGVRTCQVSDLCNYIIEAHASPAFHSHVYPRAELISHAKFLFENSWSMREVDIWFATSTDQSCRGSRLYMRGAFKPNSPESRVFEQLSKHFSVIHDDYLADFNTQKERGYLKDVLQVWSIPRLVENDSVNEFHLSEDFKVLFRVCEASDILQVLCEYWWCYSRWIKEDGQASEAESRSRLSLIRSIGEMDVQTRTGSSKLQDTMLSGLDPNIESEVSLPTLDLKIHDGFARQALKHIGITVETNIHFYLLCLRHAQHEKSLRKEAITYLYEKIQDQCDGHEELVMDFFKRNRSIYVEPTKKDTANRVTWVTLEECAKSKVNLEARYPTCRQLFGITLESETTGLSHLLKRAESITLSTGLIAILRIFKGINRTIGAMEPLKAIRAVKPLITKSIMPVRKPGSTLPYILVAPQDAEWFIADRMYLQVSFYDKVPLLAFSVDEMLEITQILQSLHLDSRRLSQCVRELSNPQGPFKHCNGYESFLRNRVAFIEELIPSSNSGRETLLRHLKSISVTTAAAVVQRYVLEHGNSELEGRPNEANVSSSFNDKGMKLFLSNEDYPSHQTIFDIGDEIAQYCGINDTQHLRLLYETLSESNTQTIQTRFAKRGLHVRVPVQDTSSKGHRARAGDLFPFAYPIPCDRDYLGDELKGADVQTRRGGRRNRPREEEIGQPGSDRRLPILKLADSHFKTHGLYYMGGESDPTGDLQFIGQHIVSQFLEACFGNTYDPVTHWTSELRMRAGFPRPEICDSQAAFTMAGSRTSTEVIDFLCCCGFNGVKRWRGALQTVHFDVVASESATGSPFLCSWSQIQRFRRYKLDGCSDQCPRDVAILLSVRNVYQHPLVEISINPWGLFCSEEWFVPDEGYFRVSIGGHPTDPIPSQSDSQTAIPPPEIFVQSPQTTVEEGPELASVTNIREDLPKSMDTDYAEQLVRSTRSSLNVSAVMGMKEWANHDYVYKHLDDGSFRVFILFPGGQDDVLRGEICTIPLTSDRRYRALSYVWGTENQPTHTILTTDGILTVKASLSDALLAIRQKTSRVRLWIDAICINQTDAKEKAHQIRLLPKIFQNASCTVAFLGAGKSNNDAITTLMQINAKSVCGSEMEDWPKDLPPPPLSWEGRSIPGAESQIWTEVIAFFRLPWFRRAWIIQEAVAAPTVTMVCGGLVFDWNDLFEAMKLVDHELPISDTDAASWSPFMTLGWHREREARHTRYPLAQLLERYRHVHSTLARDRFFALLGLASDGDNPEYAPDYNASFEDIVVKIARAFVAQGKGMTLLNAAGLGSQPDRFPSWIPDWTITTSGSLTDPSSLNISFNASGVSKEDMHCGNEPDLLIVKGRAQRKLEI